MYTSVSKNREIFLIYVQSLETAEKVQTHANTNRVSIPTLKKCTRELIIISQKGNHVQE